MAERTDRANAEIFPAEAHPGEEHPAEARPADDRWLKAALVDVPVPDGLERRIKAALRTHTILGQVKTSPSGAEAAAANVPLRVDTETEPADQGWVRRGLIILALAAGICGFAVLAGRWSQPAEPSWLVSHCNLILEKLDADNPATWEKIDRDAPGIPAAVQAQLARVAFIARRPLAGLGSKLEGTLYRLDAGDGRGIILMKLDALPAIRGLTSRFEVLPQPSGGWSLAAMSVGKETFVLAAACTERQIFSYIRRMALT